MGMRSKETEGKFVLTFPSCSVEKCMRHIIHSSVHLS
jgi:hypothetical protein